MGFGSQGKILFYIYVFWNFVDCWTLLKFYPKPCFQFRSKRNPDENSLCWLWPASAIYVLCPNIKAGQRQIGTKQTGKTYKTGQKLDTEPAQTEILLIIIKLDLRIVYYPVDTGSTEISETSL